MLYPYLYRKKVSNRITAYFHPLTMDVVFAPDTVSEEGLEAFLAGTGLARHWAVEPSFSYDDYVDAFLASTEYGRIDIKTLKMFTTTECNLACAYCLIEKNLEKRGCACRNTSLKDGIEVLDRFSKLCLSQEPARRTIMLYGGEPLMNRDTLMALIRHIREVEKAGGFNGSMEIDLECNGTLVTDEIAEFLKEYGAFILISLDGTREVHNTYRKTKTGEGSYDAARRGYDTLIRHGCTAVISSVFTDAYAAHASECLAEMTDVIRPKSIGLNIFHVLEDQEIEHDRTPELLDIYVKVFEDARAKGLYIEHIMRRIRPLVTRMVRVSDCGACGNRIVSDVEGNIGICEGLVGDSRYFLKRTDYNDVKSDPEFLAWSVRTPLKMECCRGCRAMGICGGGCVSNAIRQHGNIYAPDDYSNSFIESAFSGI